MFSPLKYIRERVERIGDKMSRLFDFGASIEVPKFKKRSPEDDWENLSKDWRKVQSDLNKAFQTYKKDKEE